MALHKKFKWEMNRTLKWYIRLDNAILHNHGAEDGFEGVIFVAVKLWTDQQPN